MSYASIIFMHRMAIVLFSRREILLIDGSLEFAALQHFVINSTQAVTISQSALNLGEANLSGLITIHNLEVSLHNHIHGVTHNIEARDKTRTRLISSSTLNHRGSGLVYKIRHKAAIGIAQAVSVYYDGGSISLRISVSVCVCNHIRFIIPRFCEGGKIIPAGQWENHPFFVVSKIIFALYSIIRQIV